MARFPFAPAAAFGLFLALAPPSFAQQAANNPPEEQIIVTAPHSEEAIRNFVGQMTNIPPRGVDQLARWDRTICPGVAGLRTRYAQFLIDRIAQRAYDIDVNVGQPGCRANILIVVSPDPGAVAHDLVANHPNAMGIYYDGGRPPVSRRTVAAFETSTAAVRWWHVNWTMTRDGLVATGQQLLTGGSSRINRTTRQDFGTVFVIVDANRLNDINLDFGALADYLAMVILAPIDPAADTAALPTILNLFGTGPQGRPNAMTDWDVAYLRGLYGSTREARNSAQQNGEIARSMNRELSVPPAENPAPQAH